MMEGWAEAQRHWDREFQDQHHTGYRDALLYAYDQPLRLRKVRGLIRKYFSGGAALDVGSGAGDVLELLLKAGADHVTGIDISPRVVDFLRERFRGQLRVTLRVGSVQDLVPDGPFDLITSITVLQHLGPDAELQSAVKRLRECLGQGGHLILLEIAPNDGRNCEVGELLVERSAAFWKETFAAARFHLLEESPYAPIGITALHKLGRIIDNIRDYQCHGDTSAGPVGPPQGSWKRQVLRIGHQLVRTLVLAFCFPLDYGLRLQVPSWWAYHRVFVFTV